MVSSLVCGLVCGAQGKGMQQGREMKRVSSERERELGGIREKEKNEVENKKDR